MKQAYKSYATPLKRKKNVSLDSEGERGKKLI